MENKSKKGRAIIMVNEVVNPSTVEKQANAKIQKKKSLQDLADEQGFKPIADINQLSMKWPSNADFEAFYEVAVASRKHAQHT